MSLTATPKEVRADATALIMFIGAANTEVTFSAAPSGSILGAQAATDAQGRAFCRYQPGTVGDVVTITAQFGTP